MCLRYLATLLAIIVCILSWSASFALESARPLVGVVDKKFLGDFPKLKERGAIRVLIPFSRSFYFIDDGAEKGLAVELLREFENSLNKSIESEKNKLRLILVPTQRDELISGIEGGRGDIAVANLTITPERLRSVDFSDPFIKNVRELVITGRSQADMKSMEDIAGLTIHVRKSSSYYESLLAVNAKLGELGLDAVTIELVDDGFEDEDLMEMLNAETISAMVIDEHKVQPWLELFEGIKAHKDVPIREGGATGWAFRKDSPELANVINEFLKKNRQGTLLGNILIKRYYEGTDWISNPQTETYAGELRKNLDLFRRYGTKYDIDPLLLAALAFQESRFDNSIRSRVGAIGIMQIMPSTATDQNVDIPNIENLENNIEAGAKYIRFLADRYFSNDEIGDAEKILMALASYNAGPNRVARLRKKANDPNKWFRSVEWEVARAVGAEPVKYVKNIFIYYVLFKKTVAFSKLPISE